MLKQAKKNKDITQLLLHLCVYFVHNHINGLSSISHPGFINTEFENDKRITALRRFENKCLTQNKKHKYEPLIQKKTTINTIRSQLKKNEQENNILDYLNRKISE